MGNAQNLIDLGADFETFYDSDYTLQKLTTTQYIHDPRFQIIGLSLCVNGVLPVWLTGTHGQLIEQLAKFPWDRIRLIAHNANFDGAILEWVLGFQPAKYLCTMSGVRPYVTPYTGRADLESTLKFLPELGVQKGDAVKQFKGKRLEDFTADELHAYGVYGKDDVFGTCQLAKYLSDKLPADEQDLIDLTVKKYTRPTLALDDGVIRARQEAIKAERKDMIERLHQQKIPLTSIRSRPKFAAILSNLGVAVPMKHSAATGEETFAFSKQDSAFLELLGHENEEVNFLVDARLKLASNMEESRLERLLSIHGLDIGGWAGLPVPLLYYGAHTGRFSGLDKINLQNPPRHKYDAAGNLVLRSAIRDAIVAPDGYQIIAADLANIEARIVATLAGQWDMVADFAAALDLYSKFATQVYGRPINKKDHPVERFVGKTCILGLGYGMGWEKFLKQMRLAGIKMTEQQAKDIVYLYRNLYSRVPELWSSMGSMLKHAIDPKCLQVLGPLTFMHERIILPNGMPIIYPKLSWSKDGMSFKNRRSEDGRMWIWGGAATENATQALARIILTRAELRLARAGLKAALQLHDELIYCVPTRFVDAAKRAITMAMTAPVEFLPRLPIAVEIHSGGSYGDAK